MRLFKRRANSVVRAPVDATSGGSPVLPEASAGSDSDPVAFGYKSAWLAVRNAKPNALADALALTEVHTVSWAEGIEAARAGAPGPASIFITPTVDGWTLAVLGGSELPDDDGGGRGRLDLAALSRRFGEAQKFATHRVVEYHEWQRWVNGLPTRRYSYLGESGEVLLDEGDPLQAEGNLLRADNPDADDVDLADEEVVMAIAEAWSIDPRTLDVRDDLPRHGLLGLAG